MMMTAMWWVWWWNEGVGIMDAAALAVRRTLEGPEVTRSRLIQRLRRSHTYRRLVAVTSTIPLLLSYVAASPTGFHSGSTTKHVPNMLNNGFMLEVILAPRVRVTRMCAASLIPFAARVRKMAWRMYVRAGTFWNAMALAESIRRLMCSSSLKTLLLYTGEG